MANAPRRWAALDITLRDVAADLELEGHLLAFLDDHQPTAITAPPGDDAGWHVSAGDSDDATPAWLADPETAVVRSVPTRAWRVFFATPEARSAARDALAASSQWAEQLDVAEVEVEDEGWAERSQAALRAVRVGSLIIAPPWDIPDADDARVVIIEPSMGFGTGHHQSTRLCLQALQGVDLTARRVLDLGTGSGVLAIAAAVLGATTVVAVDDDRDAVDAAAANVRLNHVETRVSAQHRDLASLQTERADVVLANLTGALLRKHAAIFTTCLDRHALLIVSGFTQDERLAVTHALCDTRELQLLREDREDGWMSLTFTA